MKAPRESVDEAIDRVAASLTHVPREFAIAARVMPRLGGRTASRGTRVFAGVAAVAVASLATAIWLASPAQPNEPRLDARPLGVEPTPALAGTGMAASVLAQPTPSSRMRSVLGRNEAEGIAAAEPARALPALGTPARLGVDDIAVVPLGGPASVEIAPLDLPSLEWADTARESSQK